MKIGMRLHDYGKNTPEVLAKLVRESGFEAGQLALYKAMDLPTDSLLQDDTLARIRAAFDGQGVALPVLGCYVEPGSTDEAQRLDGRARFLAHLDASIKLGAGCVGTETTNFAGTKSERDICYRHLVDFTAAVCERAEAIGATVGIEPVAVHTLNTPELTRQLLSDIASPSLRIIFDFSNLVTPENQDDQDRLLDRSLDCFGAKICAVHVKDGYFEGRKWINAQLGTGVMQWDRAMKELASIDDTLCCLREGVWPGAEKEEYAFIAARV